MLSFLFFIIIFVLVIVLMAISTVFGFVRAIFGIGRQNNQNQNSQTQNFEQPTNKSKIFDKAEGEYVDYEEIK
jgi:flagellar basal body-associated protein FliL